MKHVYESHSDTVKTICPGCGHPVLFHRMFSGCIHSMEYQGGYLINQKCPCGMAYHNMISHGHYIEA